MLVSSVWDIELLQKNRSAKSQRRVLPLPRGAYEPLNRAIIEAE